MEAKHNAKAGQLTDNSENGIAGEVSVEIGVCVVAGRVRETQATDVHFKRARIWQLLHFCPSAHVLSYGASVGLSRLPSPHTRIGVFSR